MGERDLQRAFAREQMAKAKRTKRTSFFNVIVSERVKEYAQNYSLIKKKNNLQT